MTLSLDKLSRLALLAGLAWAASASSALADDVTLVPGSTLKGASGGHVRGQVQSESAAEVVVKLGQNLINVPTDQIVSVRYDGQPASIALAETRESNGQLAEAADLYKKAAGEASFKPFVEQAARFKQADATAELALTDASKVAEAQTLLDAFLKAYPNGRSVGPALESLARLQLNREEYDKVEKSLVSLSKLPGGADRVAVLRARVLTRKGDFEGAVGVLGKIVKESPDGSVRQREARLGLAESLAGLKKYTEAEAEVRQVIKALPAEDAASQSVAYNTLGDCLRAAGRPKDALLAYLHTDLLFAKDKEQHPRALAHISRLWRELRRDDRADEVFQRLKTDYPQSKWLSSSKATP